MTNLIDFLKTTLRGGFFVVLPIVIVILVIIEAVDLLIVVFSPITELLPVDEIGGIEVATAVAVLILLLMCFLIGLAMKMPIGVRFGSWLNHTVFSRIPGYTMVKELTQGFSGDAAERSLLQPAVVTMPLESLVLAFIIEEHNNGDFTIFIPAVPTPNIGRIEYVHADRVRKLDVPASSVANSMMQWGVGSGAWFHRSPD
jgi:uncharacterized membrane protein